MPDHDSLELGKQPARDRELVAVELHDCDDRAQLFGKLADRPRVENLVDGTGAMGRALLAGEGRLRDGLHRTRIVEKGVDERRLVVGGHAEATERRRDVGVGSGVDLWGPVEEVLPVAVRPADCGEHAPQVRVGALKAVQLGWPRGRLCRRSLRQGE